MNREQRILEKLKCLRPQYVGLVNESDSHAGPLGRETHFKLLLVSNDFEGLNRVERQRKVLELLRPEMETGLHALSLRLLTPQEWDREPEAREFQSPECASKREK